MHLCRRLFAPLFQEIKETCFLISSAVSCYLLHIYVLPYFILIQNFSTKCNNRKISDVIRVNFCYLLFAIWGFRSFLFLFCFFCEFLQKICIDYQCFTFKQQIFKKSIMMIVGACIFLVAAAQALPLFFGL